MEKNNPTQTGMLYYGFFLLWFTCSISSAFSQANLKRYIANNSVAIQSIAISDTNFSDLTSIGNAVGEARVVMLGEQDHGDAPTFMAKARLVKYLHEKLGFKVLAFESDFFGLTQGYERVLNDSAPIDTFLIRNLFPIWTTCRQFAGMMDYITDCDRTVDKLMIAGIDNQLHGEYTAKNFKKELDVFLTLSQIPFSYTDLYKDSFLPLVDTVVYYSGRQQTFRNSEQLTTMLSYIETLVSQLKDSFPQNRFWLAAIENLGSVCRDQILRQSSSFANSFIERDKQMAANLTWLLKVKYPKEKVIVWAANGHIIKNALNAVKPQNFRHHSLGHYFTQQTEFADKTYVLGFTSYQGSAGRTTVENGIYSFPPPSKNSFEQWVNDTRRDYIFVDFKRFNHANPTFDRFFFMNGESHFQQKGVWTKAFDGIFFIKNMYPCHK